jgi:orotate phosphoribosyltransferase
MDDFQQAFARVLAECGALFFDEGLRLKDGRPTPYFVNMGLFRTGRLSYIFGSFMARMLAARGLAGRIDTLVGPSYKGSAIAVAVAQALWLEHGFEVGFDYDRKEAKAHGEASRRETRFVTGALLGGGSVFIVDDVATTMHTKDELIGLIQSEAEAQGLRLSLLGVGLGIDREQTEAVYDGQGRLQEGVKGGDAVALFTSRTGLPVHFLAGIREVVDFLGREGVPVRIRGVRRPLDADTLREFEVYMATYGVEPR